MIDLPALKANLLAYPETEETYPFGPEAMVIKVSGKMFALVSLTDDPMWINLKCDPNDALALRDQYPAVQPGYHMNKRHWNTVTIDGTIPDAEVWQMIDHSFRLVVKGLKKADRDRVLTALTK